MIQKENLLRDLENNKFNKYYLQIVINKKAAIDIEISKESVLKIINYYNLESDIDASIINLIGEINLIIYNY